MAAGDDGAVLDLTPPTPVDRAWQLAYRAAFPVVRLGWRVWPRQHQGALVALRLGDGVLLVRSSYRKQLSFPGGGIEPGETPSQAAARELREEIGLDLPISGEPVVVEGVWEGRPDRVFVFDVPLVTPPALRIDNREVVGARFVPWHALPTLPLSGPVREYVRRVSAAEHEHPRP